MDRRGTTWLIIPFSFSGPPRTTAHFVQKAQRPHWPMPTLTLVVPPGCLLEYPGPLSSNPAAPSEYLLCRESWNSPVCNLFSFRYPAKVPSVCRAQIPPAYAHFSFSYLVRTASSVERTQGPPGPHTTSTPVALPRHTLHRMPWDTLNYTHFNFSGPARVPSVHRTLEHCGLHPLQL